MSRQDFITELMTRSQLRLSVTVWKSVSASQRDEHSNTSLYLKCKTHLRVQGSVLYVSPICGIGVMKRRNKS